MKRIFFMIIIIFFVSCTVIEADPQKDDNKKILENGKEILYLLEKLNKATTKGNAWEIRDMIDLDNRSENKKETSGFMLKMLNNTDYRLLYEMIDETDFNNKFLNNKQIKFYEVNSGSVDNTVLSSLILSRRTEENYIITVVKNRKTNTYNDFVKISFELKKKGKKYKIVRVGIFSS